MHVLELKAVPGWTEQGRKWVPRSVDARCPHCGRTVTFTPENWHNARACNTLLSPAVCPGCNKKVSFFVVDPGPSNDKSKQGCKCLAMFPAPNGPRAEVPGIDLVPERIKKAYRETLAVFNSGVWSATATLCRRTLEGVIGELLGDEEEDAPLAARLKKLAETKRAELAEPIITLSHSLREGGNLGAHFDKETDPDPDMATAMLDLIEYLIQYVYALPGMIRTLDQKLGPPGPTSAD